MTPGTTFRQLIASALDGALIGICRRLVTTPVYFMLTLPGICLLLPFYPEVYLHSVLFFTMELSLICILILFKNIQKYGGCALWESAYTTAAGLMNMLCFRN